MSVNILSAYNNPYTNSISENLSNNNLDLVRQQNNGEQRVRSGTAKDSAEAVLTKQEKRFFKKLFPENSDQIERHVLFNRNGKITNTPASKGSIFDGIG